MYKFKNPDRNGAELLKKSGYVEFGEFQQAVTHDIADTGKPKGYFCANCKFHKDQSGTLYNVVCEKLNNAEVAPWGCCNLWSYAVQQKLSPDEPVSGDETSVQPETEPSTAPTTTGKQNTAQPKAQQTTEPVQAGADSNPDAETPKETEPQMPQPKKTAPAQPAVQKSADKVQPKQQTQQPAAVTPKQTTPAQSQPADDEETFDYDSENKKRKVAESIRKMVKKRLIENIKKYKSAKIETAKVSKSSPKMKMDRTLTKEDDSVLNSQYEKAVKKMESDKTTGVPSDKEWKRYRNAEEVPLSATTDEIYEVWNKLVEKIADDTRKMHELSEKINDKTLCDLISEMDTVHNTLCKESRERYKFIRLQDSFKPINRRVVSLKQVSSEKDKLDDMDKLIEIVEKYLKIETKKKYDTMTEKIDDENKESEKKLKK